MIVTIAGCMISVGNVMYKNHITYVDPAQMAISLSPYLGSWIKNAILILMCNAAMLGAMTISLSSAWAYGEVKGWNHSISLSFKQAPRFYLFLIGSIAAAASVVLIPNAPLQLIIISVQVLAGLMLPSAIIFLQLLLNDKELLGEKYINKKWNNIINWTVIVVLFILSFTLAAQIMLPEFFK
jgi:Mn2+/Fe2+ NRAMP family transporter